MDPAMRVGRAAALDTDQGGLQFLGLGARAAVADLEFAVLASDRADRRDDGGRATGEGLAQAAAAGVGAPLVDRIAVLANLDALVVGQRDQCRARDAGL